MWDEIEFFPTHGSSFVGGFVRNIRTSGTEKALLWQHHFSTKASMTASKLYFRQGKYETNLTMTGMRQYIITKIMHCHFFFDITQQSYGYQMIAFHLFSFVSRIVHGCRYVNISNSNDVPTTDYA